MGKMMNRGRKRRKESERQAHDDLSDEELDATIAEIASGSDRVCAILGGALVQNALIGALVTCFKDKSELGKLFDNLRGPLNSFYGQILIGRALGLFDSQTAAALHEIRSIRNKFAHSATSLTFDSHAEVVAKCTALKHLASKDRTGETISDERYYFEEACFGLTCELVGAGTANLQKEVLLLEKKVLLAALSGRANHLGKLGDLLKLIPTGIEGSV